jgi:hypothetical protein
MFPTAFCILRAAVRGDYEWVVSGCDWGGSDHIPELRIKRSTTVHVIAGILPTGEFDLLHFRRYEGMNYDDITADILRMHKTYRGYALASDFGVGAVYNSGLRKEIPLDRHLIFNFVGPASPLVSQPDGPHQYNQYSLNKTEAISLMFEAVRHKRFRCFDFEFAQHYLEDFCICSVLQESAASRAGVVAPPRSFTDPIPRNQTTF